MSSPEAGRFNAGTEIQSSLEPLGELSVIAGFAVPLNILSNTLNSNDAANTSDRNNLLKLAAKVLADPMLQRQLGERVYELMQEDLRRQKERSTNYGSRFDD